MKHDDTLMCNGLPLLHSPLQKPGPPTVYEAASLWQNWNRRGIIRAMTIEYNKKGEEFNQQTFNIIH